ncbi:hypothetical protein Tco_1453599 [Tanacetum coccineum]
MRRPWIIIDDGTSTTTITCLSPEVHTFVPPCNKIVNAIKNKDTRHVPDALKRVKNTPYIIQYHFRKGAKPGNPDFTLDAAFKSTIQPNLSLPTPETATPPPAEILEQTSSMTVITATKENPSPLTKDVGP